MKHAAANQESHVDGMTRLKMREDCYLRQGFKENDRRSKRQIDEQRKKEMIDYNMHTFGKVAIGVHGKELPKFSNNPDTL